MNDQENIDKTSMTRRQRYAYRLSHLSLHTVVFIVICAAGAIVVAGYLMYDNDSNRKYDIARPGQQDDNEVLTVEDDEADTNSAVTPEAAKQKIENFTKEINALSGISSFNPEDLSDQNIQLAPPDQPSL